MPVTKEVTTISQSGIPSNCFYVYIILENGIPCYVGKGKGNRVLQHFKGNGNLLLGTKIKADPIAFTWIIDKVFSDEHDCLLHEKSLIIDYKQQDVKLYNVTYYSSDGRKGTDLKGIFVIFKQWEQMVFPPTFGTLPLYQSVDIVLSIIKTITKGMNVDRIPIYKGKRLNELTYRIKPAYSTKDKFSVIIE